MKCELSIVIIGRNEEQGIAKCIAAAQKAAAEIGGAEIIFVDSASTDMTAEIVSSMGVRVVPLDSSRKLCPSAGRFVGSQHATGEFVLFIDADTLVYEGFLGQATEHFRAHPLVAGINGRIDDLNEKGERLDGVEDRYDGVADVKWLRGPCCFYRRSALMECGSFDPQLAMEEEAELGLRLVRAGWKLNILPTPMACHTRAYHCQTFTSLFSTFKRDIVSGRLGEITRTIAVAHRAGNGLAFCWLRLRTTSLMLAWFFLLAASLLLPVFGLSLFSMLSVLGLFAICLKKRSIWQTLVFIPSKLLCLVDVLAGLPYLVDEIRKESSRKIERFGPRAPSSGGEAELSQRL